MKKIIGAIALAICLCGAGFFYYKSYISSPEYVFNEALDAYENKNFSDFENYF